MDVQDVVIEVSWKATYICALIAIKRGILLSGGWLVLRN